MSTSLCGPFDHEQGKGSADEHLVTVPILLDFADVLDDLRHIIGDACDDVGWEDVERGHVGYARRRAERKVSEMAQSQRARSDGHAHRRRRRRAVERASRRRRLCPSA